MNIPIHLRQSRRPAAFTLVELLVVVGIIALLISVLLPALNKARESAKTVYCASNLRQLGLSLQMYGNDFGGKYPVLLPTITGWPSYWGSCRWDDFLILTGYIKNTEVLRCPSANQYLELLFYDVPAPFDGTKAAVYSIRHYGMPVFGIGGGTSAGPFALVNVNVSTIRNAAERVALGDSDPGFYPLYHSVDAAAWGYGHLNTWMLDGDDGSSWHGVSAIRHAKGGNYLYLDGHVSFGAHSEVNFDQSPGKWASWWYHPQAPAIP